jgi:hypothetical protein
MARRSARKAAGSRPPRRHEPSPPPPSRRRPPRLALAIGAAVVVGGAAAGLLLTSGGRSESIEWSSVPHLQTSAPPWPSESALLPARLRPSGLHQLTMEGTALHIHEHLDLFVSGRRVRVPALVGIDQQAGFLTELHTHDASGIIHVESPVPRTFTLGQFFCEWGVKLSATCLGRYRGPLSWWGERSADARRPRTARLASAPRDRHRSGAPARDGSSLVRLSDRPLANPDHRLHDFVEQVVPQAGGHVLALSEPDAELVLADQVVRDRDV